MARKAIAIARKVERPDPLQPLLALLGLAGAMLAALSLVPG